MQISEKQIEDWAEKNIGVVCGNYRARLIGRQVTLHDGSRVDLLAQADHPPNDEDGPETFYVIEIKAETMGVPALRQVLGYARVIIASTRACDVEVLSDVRSVLLGPDASPELMDLVAWIPQVGVSFLSNVFDVEWRQAGGWAGGAQYIDADLRDRAGTFWRDGPAFTAETIGVERQQADEAMVRELEAEEENRSGGPAA